MHAPLEHAPSLWLVKKTDPTPRACAAFRCPLLSKLSLLNCGNITDSAVEAIASGLQNLTFLDLTGCELITDAAVLALSSCCTQLERLGLYGCDNLTDETVVATQAKCKLLKHIHYSTVADKRAARKRAFDKARPRLALALALALILAPTLKPCTSPHPVTLSGWRRVCSTASCWRSTMFGSCGARWIPAPTSKKLTKEQRVQLDNG